MKIGKYIGTTTVTIAALYAIFFGCAAAFAIFESITWDEVWSVSGKVGLVALIILAINVVIAILVSLIPRKSDKK
ncbi:hypothetical protein FWF74_01405 [Candidatus Saccharibacteria bacterium]|nr:hypothetical protein [Candidatus Saccharibacteria bacterium]MCL1963108.1 hypothetical protein [Candidatus Saccharibacteria bacterium]